MSDPHLERTQRLGAAAAVVLLLMGCASQRAKPQPRAAVQMRPLPPPVRSAPPLTPAAYVAAVGTVDLFIERASQLALQRSSSVQVRSIATALLQDHRGLSAQLSLSGRRLDLLPAARLSPRLQLALDSLVSTSAFNQLYLQDMVNEHRTLLAAHRSFASAGASPTLRDFASYAIPIEVRHLQQLNSR